MRLHLGSAPFQWTINKQMVHKLFLRFYIETIKIVLHLFRIQIHLSPKFNTLDSKKRHRFRIFMVIYAKDTFFPGMNHCWPANNDILSVRF